MNDAPEVSIALLEYLKPLLIGRDPLDIERHWHNMWRPKLVGRRGITTRVISGVDIALWDLKGKFANMPLYKLLGGYDNSVDTYIAGGYYEEGKGLKELAEEMARNVELGATAVKMKVGAVPINEDVERVRVVREAVGSDIRVMVDANMSVVRTNGIDRDDRPFGLGDGPDCRLHATMRRLRTRQRRGFPRHSWLPKLLI